MNLSMIAMDSHPSSKVIGGKAPPALFGSSLAAKSGKNKPFCPFGRAFAAHLGGIGDEAQGPRGIELAPWRPCNALI